MYRGMSFGVNLCDLNVVGSPNTHMTWEFTGNSSIRAGNLRLWRGTTRTSRKFVGAVHYCAVERPEVTAKQL
jgi:hypothetical protein